MSTEQDPSNPAGNQPPKKPKLKLKLKSKGGAKGANKPSLKLGKKASGEKLALNPQSNTGDTNPPPAGVTQPPMSNPVSIPPADVPPVPETDIAPTAELPPAPVPLGESPPQADLPPLPEVPAVGEEETLSVPPPLSPSPVAAEEAPAPELPPAPAALGESPPQADLPPLPEVPAAGEEETLSVPPPLSPPPVAAEEAPAPELPPAPAALGESPPQADLPPLPEVPAVGEEEALPVPPPLSPSPVAAEEEAATALPESNQKLPTLKDVSDDLKEEDKADVFTPSSTETSEADDTIDEDENATEDDEEEELCEISKLKVNIMVLKNKLKTLENQISCSQDDNQGNQSTSDLHDQFNELSANYSRFKEEYRDELNSLSSRLDQLNEMPAALRLEDEKIDKLKNQLETAENKREENKKMILSLIDEIKQMREVASGESPYVKIDEFSGITSRVNSLEKIINSPAETLDPESSQEIDSKIKKDNTEKLHSLLEDVEILKLEVEDFSKNNDNLSKDEIEKVIISYLENNDKSEHNDVSKKVKDLDVKITNLTDEFASFTEEPPPPPPIEEERSELTEKISFLEERVSNLHKDLQAEIREVIDTVSNSTPVSKSKNLESSDNSQEQPDTELEEKDFSLDQANENHNKNIDSIKTMDDPDETTKESASEDSETLIEKKVETTDDKDEVDDFSGINDIDFGDPDEARSVYTEDDLEI